MCIVDRDEGKICDASLSRELCDELYENARGSVTTRLWQDDYVVNIKAFWGPKGGHPKTCRGAVCSEGAMGVRSRSQLLFRSPTKRPPEARQRELETENAQLKARILNSDAKCIPALSAYSIFLSSEPPSHLRNAGEGGDGGWKIRSFPGEPEPPEGAALGRHPPLLIWSQAIELRSSAKSFTHDVLC